ncbi:MAG: NADH:flavin oxidoreductase [Pseudomonadota bacterium]
MTYNAIYSPGSIGSIRLRNRIVMPAMGTNLGTTDGQVTDRLIEYHRVRAKGGVGMNIVEMSCVDSPEGLTVPRLLRIDHDRFIPGLEKLADAIRKGGSIPVLQLQHAGGMAASRQTGMQPVSASAVQMEPFREVSRPLSVGEIERIESCFALSAKRAREAGFDAVEIHGAHVYLLQQFLSSILNKREDQYGGCLENRARFLLETIKAVRSEVGKDYVVWCRLICYVVDHITTLVWRSLLCGVSRVHPFRRCFRLIFCAT